MEDSIFANLLLKQVDAALKSSPTAEDCLNLLKIFDPSLTIAGIHTKAQRTKLFKEVKLRIHPDKHPSKTKKDASRIFQKLDPFVTACEGLDLSAPLTPSPENEHGARELPSKFPESFNGHTQWPCLTRLSTIPAYTLDSSLEMCYHMRGQLFHYGHTQKDIGLLHKPKILNFKKLVYDPLLGSLWLESEIETIKEEITRRGPVVSRSYQPAKLTYRENDYPVIIGWDNRTVQGKVWVVRVPSRGATDFHIPVGTCSIEKEIMIPREDLTTVKWQPGAYLNINSTTDQWKTWTFVIAEKSMKDFKTFWKELGVTKASLLFQQKVRFQVYGGTNLADSRSAYVTDLEFVDEGNVKVHATFI